MRAIGKQAGLSLIHPHLLRSAFIMAALDAGVPLREVQIAARHADPRTTTIYDRRRANFDHHQRYGTATCSAERLPADELDTVILDALRRTYERSDLIETAVHGARARAEKLRTRHDQELAFIDTALAKAEEFIERCWGPSKRAHFRRPSVEHGWPSSGARWSTCEDAGRIC